jgi:hypothetical protein
VPALEALDGPARGRAEDPVGLEPEHPLELPDACALRATLQVGRGGGLRGGGEPEREHARQRERRERPRAAVHHGSQQQIRAVRVWLSVVAYEVS